MNKFQWRMFQRLLERGVSIMDALEMMKKCYKDNEFIKDVTDGLMKGNEFRDMLDSSSFSKEISFYSRYLPLEKSIDIAFKFHDNRKRITDEILSKNIYQLFLLAASVGLLFLFSSYIMPVILFNTGLDSSTDQHVHSSLMALNTLKWIMTVSVIMFMLFVFWVMTSRKENMIWIFLHRIKMDRWIRIMITYDFAMRLKTLLLQGISFAEAVTLIRFKDTSSPVSLLAHHFDMILQHGTDFEESLDMEFFDDDFHSLCMYGIRNDDFIGGLEDYLAITELKIQKMLKKISTGIQIFCYGFVMAVVITAYRILMLPLEMLNGI